MLVKAGCRLSAVVGFVVSAGEQPNDGGQDRFFSELECSVNTFLMNLASLGSDRGPCSDLSTGVGSLNLVKRGNKGEGFIFVLTSKQIIALRDVTDKDIGFTNRQLSHVCWIPEPPHS